MSGPCLEQMRNIALPDSLFIFRKFPVGREFAGRSTRAAGKGVREGAGGRYSTNARVLLAANTLQMQQSGIGRCYSRLMQYRRAVIRRRCGRKQERGAYSP